MKKFFQLIPSTNIRFLLFLVLIIQGCAHLPDNSTMERSAAVLNQGNTSLDKMVAQQAKDNPRKTGALLLSDGVEAFVARAALSIAAEKSLDIQYYIFNEDKVGLLLTNQVLKAADRGVRVRLLLDDMDQIGNDSNLLALDSHPNIQIRTFNPFSRSVSSSVQFITRLGDVTRRMHNKMFIADNSMAIIGGRNIGDDYFDVNPNRAFSDLDSLLTGNIVEKASQVFDLYWNSEVVYPIHLLSKKNKSDNTLEAIRFSLNKLTKRQSDSPYINALRTSKLGQHFTNKELPFIWVNADIIFDDPIKVRTTRDAHQFHLTKKLEPYFQHIESELLIITPYFVPGNEGIRFLSALRDKGIKITIITNSLSSSDVSAVHSGYSRYRKTLLKQGILLYEMKPKVDVSINREQDSSNFGSSKTSLHAKSFVLDRTHIFIGSLNLDPRSVYENTEVGTILTSTSIAENMVTSISQNIDKMAFKVSLKNNQITWLETKGDAVIVHTTEPHTNWWHRLLVRMMQILPIESQL